MRSRHALGALALALALASAQSAAAVGFDLTAQNRHVDVAIAVSTYDCFPPPTGCTLVSGPVNHGDSKSAPDFSTFAATAAVPSFGGFSASQSSSLSPTMLSAQGTGMHTGSGGYTPPPPNRATVGTGSSDSHFEASFDVASPTPIHLTGSVGATGGLSANSTVRIRLRTAGGTTIAEVVAETDPNCLDQSCAVVGPFPIDHTSVLAPGSYVLEASTSGSGAPFYFATNFFEIQSTGTYQVELSDTAVPALGPFALGALALSLALAASPLLARARR
jgi:hypothetical protein